MRGRGDLIQGRFNYGVRYIPAVIPRARWRNTLMYRAHPDFQVGVEYNPLVGEVGPLANLRAVRETKNRPAVVFGTSSDRIGTPFGTAYYMTIAKDLEPFVKLPVAPYFGVLYGSFDDEVVFPFGAAIRLGKHWTLTPQFDGHAVHGLLGYTWDRYSVTGVLVRGREPGVAFNVAF